MQTEWFFSLKGKEMKTRACLWLTYQETAVYGSEWRNRLNAFIDHQLWLKSGATLVTFEMSQFEMSQYRFEIMQNNEVFSGNEYENMIELEWLSIFWMLEYFLNKT